MSKKVYVIWNPLHERVVCVHSSENKHCKLCDDEREKIKNTGYFLEGKWFSVDSGQKLCYCGSEIDSSNPDCIEFSLCEEHALDA